MSLIRLQNISIGKKLTLLTLISLVFMLLISAFFLNMYRNALFEDRKSKTENLVEVAYSAIEDYVNKSKSGVLSEDEAKKGAMEAVGAMRYEGNNYFWINDMFPRMIMHPIKPELNQKDISKSQDPSGKFLFVEMAKVVKENGEGFVDYMWAKPGLDPNKPMPKISYVKGVPEWGWVVGSGIYVDDVDHAFMQSLKIAGSIIFALVALLGFISWQISRNIVVPVSRLSNNLLDLAENRNTEISDHDRKDEIGSMATSLKHLDTKLQEAKELERQQKELEERSELEKKQAMVKMAHDFDAQIGGLIVSLSSASTELQSTAEAMRSVADHTSGASQGVADSSNKASENVSTVASAMEEMSASSNEISAQMASVKNKSGDTASNAQTANDTVNNLDQLAENIGEVVIAIRDIAEQTNLLALNATIEAARAGDAGKGFAVVADEVKKLASETAQKTEEINTRITEIQGATKEAVIAMEKIIENIADIDDSVTGVSAAVEEQNSTTAEIVRSVSEASEGVRNVSQIIMDVQKGASETGQSSDTVLEAAREVAELSENLKRSVDMFLDEIRGDGQKPAQETMLQEVPLAEAAE